MARTADYIIDFSGKLGDKLDLRLMDANATIRSDQQFTFIGEDEFTAAAQVRYERTEKETYVFLNTDADAVAEAVIRLKGSFDLRKEWFVL